jgi:periplasmic protein CpxP/Spy
MMKLLVFVMALFVVTGLKAQQQQRTPEERAKIETDTVKARFALTDAQAADYQKVALKYMNERNELRNIPRDSMQLRMRKMNEITEKQLADVKPILSADQYAKYEKWLKERGGRMGGGPRGGGQREGGPRGGGNQPPQE